MYLKESEQAYDRLPRLELSDLEYGDIINMTPGRVGPVNPLRIVYHQIVNYQRRGWGEPLVYSVHTWFHLWEGRIFEVTPPRPIHRIIRRLEDLNPSKYYPVCRYRDHRITTAVEREIFWRAMQQLHHTRYGYERLVSILINQIIGWPETKYLPVFDLGRRHKVCSTLARGLWVNWHEKYAKPRGLDVRRPGGPLHVERTDPALMENEETFELVGVLNAGAARGTLQAPVINRLQPCYA